jgi:hypothetical protein
MDYKALKDSQVLKSLKLEARFGVMKSPKNGQQYDTIDIMLDGDILEQVFLKDSTKVLLSQLEKLLMKGGK